MGKAPQPVARRGRVVLRRADEAATAHPWQLAWYIALFGEPESISGKADVIEEGIKPNVTMRWRREALDRIIAEEGEELKPLLGPISKQGGGSREAEGPAVKSWRELVDAIDWSWVLKRVEELAGALKPWIGPERASDAEREGLARRMLGELALLVHFAEARRGMDDGEWRKERVKRLAKAVEALSGGRIRGEHAERLAQAIIYYAKGPKEYAEGLIESLVKEVGVSKKEVWGIVEFVLSDMYCLARDCARDEVVRKFVEPALELIMLEKALDNDDEPNRERARLLFGEMYATAIAGDGYVGPDMVKLTVGGELGGGAALLRLATLHLLNRLLTDDLKFDARIYVDEGRYYNITATGENAARFMRLLAVTAPSAGGEYLSDKFNGFVEAAKVEVRPGGIRLTEKGRVAADLIISEAGVAIKYNVYLSVNAIELHFRSADRSRAELAALLLRHAGVSAKVRKTEVGGRDRWYIEVSTDKLAAGRVELRNALAEIVREVAARGRIDAGKAERWLEKLERGRTLKEGWPRYKVRLVEGALVVRYETTNSGNVERAAQRFRDMGLEGGRHFTVKMLEGGRKGYVSVLKEGLERAAWLSEHGSERQRELAAEFVEYILQRAGDEGEDVYRKVLEVVKEGRARGSLRLEGFEKRVEVEGGEHVVKVIDGGAEFEESESGKLLLRIKITAEVDDVKSEYAITFGRRGGGNAVEGRTTARADAPGGREADAERFSALVEALTGKKPRIQKKSDGTIELVCGRKHLEGFMRYAELADAIAKWLEETRRR